MCVEVKGPHQVSSTIILSFIFWDRAAFTEPRAQWLTEQAGQWALRIYLPLYAWVTEQVAVSSFLNVVSGNLNSALCSGDRHLTDSHLSSQYVGMLLLADTPQEHRTVPGKVGAQNTFINEQKFLITAQWESEIIVEETGSLGSQVTLIRCGRMWRSRHRAEPSHCSRNHGAGHRNKFLASFRPAPGTCCPRRTGLCSDMPLFQYIPCSEFCFCLCWLHCQPLPMLLSLLSLDDVC